MSVSWSELSEAAPPDPRTVLAVADRYVVSLDCHTALGTRGEDRTFTVFDTLSLTSRMFDGLLYHHYSGVVHDDHVWSIGNASPANSNYSIIKIDPATGGVSAISLSTSGATNSDRASGICFVSATDFVFIIRNGTAASSWIARRSLTSPTTSVWAISIASATSVAFSSTHNVILSIEGAGLIKREPVAGTVIASVAVINNPTSPPLIVGDYAWTEGGGLWRRVHIPTMTRVDVPLPFTCGPPCLGADGMLYGVQVGAGASNMVVVDPATLGIAPYTVPARDYRWMAATAGGQVVAPNGDPRT